MSRRARLLIGWAFVVQVLAVRAFADGVLPVADRATVTPVRVDVNRASVAELQVLPSIGPRRAEAIVLERVRGGPFRDVDALARVPGLGPHARAAMAPALSFR